MLLSSVRRHRYVLPIPPTSAGFSSEARGSLRDPERPTANGSFAASEHRQLRRQHRL